MARAPMSERFRGLRASLVMVLVAVLCALALGALWALASTFGLEPPVWLAFPAGMAMAAVLRFSHPQPRGVAVTLAGLGTLLAGFYAECLQLLMHIAAQLGLPLIEVIRTSGIVGSAPLAWRLLPAPHLLIYVLAAALAAFLTALPRSARP